MVDGTVGQARRKARAAAQKLEEARAAVARAEAELARSQAEVETAQRAPLPPALLRLAARILRAACDQLQF